MDNDLVNCSICLEEFKNRVILNCGHGFCKECINEWILLEKYHCPLCRTLIEYIDLNSNIKYLNCCIFVSIFSGISFLFVIVISY